MTTATALALALLVALASPAPAAARKRTPCGDTAWVVADAPIIAGDATLQHNGIVLRDGRLAIGGACAPAKAKRKASKAGTRLAARWKSCAGVTGPVRLKALADATCTTLTGTITARKANLSLAVTATAVPTGAVTGQIRIVRQIAVPESVRTDLLAHASEVAAGGKTVAADGSTIANAPTGAGGWLVRVGDASARTADGTFALMLDAAPATEAELFHPSDETAPAAVFWTVPHLAAAGGTPVPVDVEVTTHARAAWTRHPRTSPRTARPSHRRPSRPACTRATRTSTRTADRRPPRSPSRGRPARSAAIRRRRPARAAPTRTAASASTARPRSPRSRTTSSARATRR